MAKSKNTPKTTSAKNTKKTEEPKVEATPAPAPVEEVPAQEVSADDTALVQQTSDFMSKLHKVDWNPLRRPRK